MAYKSFFPQSDNTLLSDISSDVQRVANNVERSNSDNSIKISDIKSLIINRFNQLESRINASDDMVNGYMDKMNKKLEKMQDNIKDEMTVTKETIGNSNMNRYNYNEYEDATIIENSENDKESKSIVKKMIKVLKKAGFEVRNKVEEEGGLKGFLKGVMYNIGGFLANMYTVKTGVEASTQKLPAFLRSIIYHIYNGGIRLIQGISTFTTTPLLRLVSNRIGVPWTDSDQSKLDTMIDMLKMDPSVNPGNTAIDVGLDMAKSIAKNVINFIKNGPILGGLKNLKNIGSDIKAIMGVLSFITDTLKSFTPEGWKESLVSMKDSVLGWFKKDKDEKEMEDAQNKQMIENSMSDTDSDNTLNIENNNESVTSDMKNVETVNNENNNLKADIPAPPPVKEEDDKKDDSKSTINILSSKIDNLTDIVMTLGKSIISQNSDNTEIMMSGLQQSSNAASSNSINTREGK